MASKNSIDTNYPIEVGAGGTGGTSHTAFAVLTGGTTSTGAVQSIASVGTGGQVLQSQGPGALPQFATVSPSSGNGMVLIETKQGASGALEFTTGIGDTEYQNYMFFFSNVLTPGTSFQISDDGGSTWVSTQYYVDNHWRAFDSTTYNTNSASNTTGWGMGSIDASFPVTGCFWLYFAGDAASPFFPAITGMFTSKQSGSSDLTLTQFMGYRDGNIAFDAFRLTNITSGTVSLYGLEGTT